MMLHGAWRVAAALLFTDAVALWLWLAAAGCLEVRGRTGSESDSRLGLRSEVGGRWYYYYCLLLIAQQLIAAAIAAH